jgi:hypothetical protein
MIDVRSAASANSPAKHVGAFFWRIVTMSYLANQCGHSSRRGTVLVALSALVLVHASAWGVDPSLILYLPLDEGSGTVAHDVSNYANVGTIVGNAAWVDGKMGNALQLVNGSHVEMPAIPQYDVTSQVSLMLWMKTDTVTTWARMIDRSQWQDNGFDLCLNQGTHAAVWEFFVNGTTSQTLGTTPLDDNEWHFVAGTFGNKTLRLYVDGKMEGTATSAGGVDIKPNTWPIRLGVEANASAGQQYVGALDEVAIFSRELADTDLLGILRNGMPSAETASTPRPDIATVDVPRDVVLSWKAGQYALAHDVYFGTASEDVNDASRSVPMGVLASQGQTAATYDPAGLLAFGQTYYWRVDEVNGAPDFTIYKGGVWSFTTEPYGYPLKPVKATASSSSNALMGPEKTMDGSGLDALDQHGNSASHMWLSKKGTTPIWIKYDFDKVYKLHQMWVWNSNQLSELDTGFGAKEVTVETSLDGTTWTALDGVMEFAQATAEPNYVHNTTVEFGGVLAKYVRLTIASNWADGNKQAGLSEVRFFYVPVKAYGASPASGSTAVEIGSELNWRPGREAVQHEVHLGTDLSALPLVKTQTGHSLGLAPLAPLYGTTYYWRVDEVNDAATPKVWEGDVWSFTTPDYGVVDDFESYNDLCTRIFFAWVDGFGYSASPDCGVVASAGNGTGSTIGNTNPPFAERTIVYGGKQAMPLAYDNTSGKSASEAIRTFDVAQDWTLGGAKTLVVFFRGVTDNGSGQLYVAVNGVKVTYGGSETALGSLVWKQWNIDLASVGTNLKSVKTLAVGVSGTGKGVLYVDDIRLYRSAPVPIQAVDPGSNGLAVLYRMEGNVKDGSGKGLDATAVGNPSYVAGLAGYGQALQFDGIDDEAVLPIGPLISTLTNATFSAWVDDSPQDGSWSRIFDFGTDNTNYVMLTPHQSTSGVMTCDIRITTPTLTVPQTRLVAPSALGTGWHHVTVVFDAAAMNVRIYQDGMVVASGATTVLPKDLGKTTQNWLGRSQFTADAHLTGSLDEFRIYSRALTAGEIRYLAGDR